MDELAQLMNTPGYHEGFRRAEGFRIYRSGQGIRMYVYIYIHIYIHIYIYTCTSDSHGFMLFTRMIIGSCTQNPRILIPKRRQLEK